MPHGHMRVDKPVMLRRTCNPGTWKAEKGGSQVHGQPQQLNEALCNLVRPYFKIKKIGLGGIAQTWDESQIPQKIKKRKKIHGHHK